MDGKAVLFFYLPDYLINTQIGKLFHASAFLANQVFVAFIVQGFFKLSNVIPELVLDDQFAI